ncbi:MAG TPA: hypothetical protein PKL48_14390 [Thermodesulfobacteriota bacterium]|nr:hypothetical protein [Thermodesulfobacteriota bacterium]
MNILGIECPVFLCNDEEMGSAAGTFQGTYPRIRIRETTDKQTRESTTLHEVLEALNWRLNLDLKHETIMRLEAGLYQVLTQNGVDLSPLLAHAKRKE